MNKYLPVGSIVEVNNNKFVIFGYLGQKEQNNEIYDYICGVFPFGIISKEFFFFNQADINKIIFIGYQNEETSFFGNQYEKIKEMLKNNCSENEIKDYLNSVIENKNE